MASDATNITQLGHSKKVSEGVQDLLSCALTFNRAMVDRISTTRLQRRLACVLSLDVAGYSRLLGEAEEATHQALKELLENVVGPAIQGCDGRIFKKTGDGVLAEFSSVVQATLCAVVIQQEMQARREGQSSGPEVRFRIGINLGEIIVESDDLYGESVNIAVRLEGLAEPGGICVSRIVAEQVGEKLPLTFADLGRQKLKNIARPVHVFGVNLPEAPLTPAARRPGGRTSRPPPEFSTRPAIAVLPFVNLTGDKDQEYFADGLTEEVIAALAGWRALPVIARNSTFALRKRAGDVRAVGSRLGALYVLEGTVRRAGSHVRIGVQLAETAGGERIFADHYDRELGEIFAVQDDIAKSIVGEISPELVRLESERVARSPQLNLDAYECYQRGLWHHYRFNKDDAEKAEELLRRALRIDRNYSPAAAALSTCIVHSVMSGWSKPERYEEAVVLAGQSVADDPRNPQAHFALGSARYHTGQIEAALLDLEAAIRLNPSHAAAHANSAFIYNYLDQPERALQFVRMAFQLSPADLRQFIWYTAVAGAYYLAGAYDQAIEAGQRGLSLRPDYLPTARYVAASLGQLGRRAEAGKFEGLLRTIDGDLAGTEATLRTFFRPAPLRRILDGLRKAGFS
jgi:adenylate cyclase